VVLIGSKFRKHKNKSSPFPVILDTKNTGQISSSYIYLLNSTTFSSFLTIIVIFWENFFTNSLTFIVVSIISSGETESCLVITIITGTLNAKAN
jgi:hypothetical protein